jgi:hypothetical protein
VEEEGGELTLEAEEEFLTEVDAVAILETLVEEVKTQVPASQLVKELTKQRFNAIIVKSMDIMHMSAERDSIIKTSKVKISHTTQITKLALCLWYAL